MLDVTFDPKRPVDDGQYFVRLTHHCVKNPGTPDSLGYWCDHAHLEHMAVALLAQFPHALARHALGLNGLIPAGERPRP